MARGWQIVVVVRRVKGTYPFDKILNDVAKADRGAVKSKLRYRKVLFLRMH
jgi:hypothetical protein